MRAQSEFTWRSRSLFLKACTIFSLLSPLGVGSLLADNEVNYHYSGPVVVNTGNFPNSATAFVEFGGEGSESPVYFDLYVASGTVNCPLTVNAQGYLEFTGLPPVHIPSGSDFPFGSLADFRSSAGAVTVQQNGGLTMIWTLGSAPTDGYDLGIGAISATGMPKGDKVGGDVTVTLGTDYASSITVNVQAEAAHISTYKLQPEGVRTAAVNGIVAVSYGDQDDSHDSSPNGFVSVTTGSQSQIHMTSADPDILVAGISAAGAVGPSKTRDGTDTNDRSVTVTHSGVITNTADSGLGIMATATGGQSSSSGAQATGSPVTVTVNGGSISATGNVGIGIFAISEGYPTNKKEDKSNAVAGGPVTVTLDQAAQITTGSATSEFSIGILAVSAGTNALIDPFSSQSVNTYGTGDSGSVTVTNNGTITTAGNMSIGIAALSIGGAGVVTNSAADIESSFSYLGAGANDETSSGSSADVTVTNSGSITTLGQSSFGIAAISTGGGGLINNAISTALNESGTQATAGLVLGNGTTAHGDPGHNAGQVTVNHNGSIQTGDGSGTGAASVGIVAQSIGGNGGSAGGKASLFVGDKGGGGGNGGAVNVTTDADSTITTHDVNSVGLLAQSIGGGGGNGGNADGLFVAVGGRGGNGGNGGALDIELSGSIATDADHSGGVIAQSIGGGGGHGGGATSVGAFVDMSIGGKGGTAGYANEVQGNLYSGGSVTTTGNNSAGVHFQSVGGGGGTGGAAYAGAAGALVSATMALGGDGGNGDNGGTVSFTNAGTITTGVPLTGEFTGLPAIQGADSIGILLQSIGGGGGHAGSAVANSLAVSPGDPPAAVGFTLTFGGTGGGASNGGTVEFTNTGTVTTWGDGSHGVLGQSIGGGGGNGGDSTASSLLFGAEGVAGSDNIAFGGQGGTAGDGALVYLHNGDSVDAVPPASITTYGQHAAAMVAQSIGGGGGNGSLGTAKAVTPTSQASSTVTVGLGAQGGGGGDGGGISVANFGDLSTHGSGSQGILAQSIGGGGGNSGGGSSVSNGNTITVSVTVGAQGTNGGSGNTDGFVVENYGSISTLGGDAIGIHAQSIGGGGGNGGSSDPTASIGSWSYLDGNPESNAAVEDPQELSATYTSTISIGGQGGSGGAGGDISVGNIAHSLIPDDPSVDGSTATIQTAGARAYGILAQSISGGGGTGGAATAYSNSKYFQNEDFNFHATLTISGDGGSSHTGGQVYATNTGNIITSGYSSHGIFSQSIGGGGGVGADGSIDISAVIGLGIDINGASGESGDGGTVTVNQNGKIETTGNDAIGVFAQSISGGGGVGTTGTSTPFFQPSGDVSLLWLTASLTLGFNLSNSDSSDGGAVTVNAGPSTSEGFNPEGGTIHTTGDWAHGILAQSIGAGGGKRTTLYGTTSNYRPDLAMQLGASSGTGAGGTATVALSSSDIRTGTPTSGYSAYGIVLQSIGGGGGLATDCSASAIGTLSLGATSGDAGGAGGTATLSGDGYISTQGRNAHAVILQSIGAGGGIAGTGSSLTDSQATESPNVILGADAAHGNGNTVTVDDATLEIHTSGANAFGLLAQSIGAGGGIATVSDSSLPSSSSDRLGGTNSASGNGGALDITLLSGSEIHTTGSGSHALVLQSIGGGGGVANPDSSANGLTTSLASPNASQTSGSGGPIQATIDAAITTTGSGAYGAVLQTIAGGGGLIGDYAGSTGSASSTTGGVNGTITFTQSGSILATGTDSVGIFAQSTGSDHNGADITLTVNGSVTGPTGIWIDAGDDNQITVSATGSITGTDRAVNYTGNAGILIDNSGTVTGSLEVGHLGTMNNLGLFNSGTDITGTQALVINSGTLDPGGANGIATQTAFGDSTILNNGPQGTLKFDIYTTLSYDSLAFSTSSEDLQAEIDGYIVSVFHYAPAYGRTTYTLLGPGNITYYNFANFTVSGLDPSVEWSYFTDETNALYLTLDVVPEPTITTLLLLATLAALATRRRPLSA